MLLDLSKFFIEPTFIYDKINKCYSSNFNPTSVSFYFDVLEINKYYFAIEYNSINKPNLILKLNGANVSNNLLTTKTGTLDKHLTFRYEFGPNIYNQGKLHFTLISNGKFPDIYKIELVKFNESLNHFSNIFNYNINDFVLIETYNLHGGFYWHLNNYLICSYFCEKYKKIPIINFHSSLFLNNTDIENKIIIGNNNWFYNYFEHTHNLPYTLHNLLINWNKKITINRNSINNIDNIDKDYLLYFDRDSFLLLAPEFHSNLKINSYIIDKYFKFLPHIKKQIEIIKKSNYPNNYFINKNLFKFIGIHYRGTDKIIETNAKEQNPKHYIYQEVFNLVKKKIESLPNYNIYIIISTDERPFIEYMVSHYGNKVIFYDNAYRSKINTEYLETDFTEIPTRNIKFDKNVLNFKQRRLYDQRETLINQSIHLGQKNLSNYKKGLDCIFDALLLSDCDVLFKSTGNFSLFCKLFNKDIDNLEVISLNDVL